MHMYDVLRFNVYRFCVQETYDRMVLDQASITLEEGLDVPFRNLWSDHVWLQTARVRERELSGVVSSFCLCCCGQGGTVRRGVVRDRGGEGGDPRLSFFFMYVVVPSSLDI